jgi:hypothetical protein
MSDRSATGRKSKRKGAAGELELAKLLQSYGYEARRGYQFDGKDIADVIGLPGIHIECKRVEKLNMLEALKQSQRDAKHDELPAVFHRRNREPWQVTMTFDDWIQLYREANHD